MKILVSGGGTREPIDGVRFITNFSTGATAAGLSDFFIERGHEVTGFFAEGAVRPSRKECRLKGFTTFQDLDGALKRLLAEERVDAIIHLAAVSDYSVAEIRNGDAVYSGGAEGKLDSRGELLIRLKPNHKIVHRLKQYAGMGAPAVVAFKLTNTPSLEERHAAVAKLQSGPGVDLVVHNDLGDRLAGRNLFTVFRNGKALATAADPRELGRVLEKFISGSNS